jgi:methylenetetrahydrofolate dehydrogenase (NADP+)/methenyltetrahydrofolate cyclohydrolase
VAKILDGQVVRKAVIAELKEKIAANSARLGAPGLAVIQLGDNPASTTYVNNKEKYAAKTGIRGEIHRLPEATTETDLHALIAKLNADPRVHGIIVQTPLPKHVSTDRALAAVAAAKDVDGLTPHSQGLLWTGRPGLRPCTPAGVMRILDYYKIALEGADVVIVGRSNLVGKPLAAMMLERHATVTLAHSRTRGLAHVCRAADVLVSAIGKAGIIDARCVKPGAVVIDVGINFVEAEAADAPEGEAGAVSPDNAAGCETQDSGKKSDGGGDATAMKLVGDVDFAAVGQIASAITPVPGGVGPMTIAMLLSNTVQAWLAAGAGMGSKAV